MEILELEITDNTPQVSLNHKTNVLAFKGDSRPEDVRKFFMPILDWLSDYGKHLHFLKDQGGKIQVNVNFDFEYFNSSSAKYLMDIIMKIGEISDADNVSLNLNWYYDELDEDMFDSGEEFQDMLDIEFNFIKH